ncbi:MAG: ribonuclease Y [Candidatus Cloacimonetes bacterium]|nr:ribonuclease Y [Candidatus Cloacimonadota bacterium]
MLKEILIPILSIIVGLVLGWYIYRIIAKKQIKNAQLEAKKLKKDAHSEAKVIKKEAELEAKEKWYTQKSKLEKEIESKKSELRKLENDYNNRIREAEKRLDKLDRREQSILDRESHLQQKDKQIKQEAEKLKELIEDETRKLMSIARMSREQAIEELLKRFEEKAKADAAKMRKKIIDETKSNAEQEALKILATAVQRSAVDYVAESTVSVVSLPSEEMKGRIIGREGRNIRIFEDKTGIEVIVDDTPEAVILSGFDPIRREIAKRSLEKLVSDGRIHPGRIESIIKKTEDEVDNIIVKEGNKTCLDIGIHNLSKNLEKLIGRLKFRTSYGQNVLKHSIETATICGILAAEIGLDQNLAKKIGLLHDIGKAVDHEKNGSHPQLGAEIAKREKLSNIIINAIEAHHEDVEPESLYAVLVQIADAVSGSRPGARRETLESYLKRLEKLEEIASSFSGIKKCYAIQAGREVRIMVEHKLVDDAMAEMLASDIAKKIEDELQYPGQIKVTVIREVRKTAQAM